jgi:hypothetical protein
MRKRNMSGSTTNPLLAKLPKGWEQIVATEYSEGASDYEVMAQLRITKGLFDKLYVEPDTSAFKEVVDFGRLMRKAWWYRQGREGLNSRQFNGNLWYTYMKNCFGWSEKTTTTTKEVEDLTSEELDARIREAVKKFNKVVKV